jgi:hypothetical protein
VILGFIRPEYDYDGLEALVGDIRMDCEVAKRSLEREAYKGWGDGDAGLKDWGWVEKEGEALADGEGKL